MTIENYKFNHVIFKNAYLNDLVYLIIDGTVKIE